MRVVFFGTPALAVPTLEAVAAHHDVVAVVCQPDKPQGRSSKLTPPPAKVCAERLGIPVQQPAKLNDGVFEAWLHTQAPEICVVAAYGRMLKQPILDVPRLGWLNVHPSLLPRWRGPSPIQTAIFEGDEVTGVSIMRIVLAMDAGDVLLQETTPIGPDENAEELAQRLGNLGAGMMIEAINRVHAGTAAFTPQDPSKVTISKMFEKAHGQIRWAQSARQLHNQVRACYPWPSAQCLYQGEVCRILKSAVVMEPADAAPGTVTRVEKDHVLVATGDGQLSIRIFQAPGKRAMAMGDFLRGHAMQPGERFEEIA
jgi:methionyl-tRNA formyltransferase